MNPNPSSVAEAFIFPCMGLPAPVIDWTPEYLKVNQVSGKSRKEREEAILQLWEDRFFDHMLNGGTWDEHVQPSKNDILVEDTLVAGLAEKLKPYLTVGGTAGNGRYDEIIKSFTNDPKNYQILMDYVNAGRLPKKKTAIQHFIRACHVAIADIAKKDQNKLGAAMDDLFNAIHFGRDSLAQSAHRDME
jgi:hypothetical protein